MWADPKLQIGPKMGLVSRPNWVRGEIRVKTYKQNFVNLFDLQIKIKEKATETVILQDQAPLRLFPPSFSFVTSLSVTVLGLPSTILAIYFFGIDGGS
jgi:hypothetical protein